MPLVHFKQYKVCIDGVWFVAGALKSGCCSFHACGYCQKGDSCPDNHDFSPFTSLTDKKTALLSNRPQFDNKVQFTVLQHTADQIICLLPKGKPVPKKLNPTKVSKSSLAKLFASDYTPQLDVGVASDGMLSDLEKKKKIMEEELLVLEVEIKQAEADADAEAEDKETKEVAAEEVAAEEVVAEEVAAEEVAAEEVAAEELSKIANLFQKIKTTQAHIQEMQQIINSDVKELKEELMNLKGNPLDTYFNWAEDV